ncbi:uncharacterized protein H6S33_006271 [Morchella sextelata]|uniref:uncharacterized protein n=1 Tax=Morchella sextelata TaxID=1174677 RepID=UPI001D054670|nr:uncharacterized protein H6S33_006271 [Morchella sextelata]KAH0604603.1 hypothetical protein H6S33_006271 [Morchella sextelata]
MIDYIYILESTRISYISDWVGGELSLVALGVARAGNGMEVAAQAGDGASRPSRHCRWQALEVTGAGSDRHWRRRRQVLEAIGTAGGDEH